MNTPSPPPVPQDSQQYRSYMVRLWRHQYAPDWRAYIQDLQTGECFNFGSMEEFLQYLFMRLAEE